LLVIVLLAAFLLGSWAQSGRAAGEQVVDRVVASVDGNPLTMQDLVNFAKANGLTLPTDNSPASVAIQRKALRALISETALEHEEQGVDVSDEQVDRFVQMFEQQHHVTEMQLRQELAANGISWEEYRRRARMEVQRMALLQRQVSDQIVITDDQVAAYYKAHPKDFMVSQERYKLAQILIALPADPTPAQVAAARAKATALDKKARGGADFAQLARKYSDDDSRDAGGELGEFKPDDIIDPILDGIRGLKPGQVSGVIRSNHGFHIVKVEAHDLPGEQPLSEVQEKIRQKLTQQQMQVQFKHWVEVDLIKNHVVHTYL